MFWNGKHLEDLYDFSEAISKIPTKVEARKFLKLYEAENRHARSNIGYISGYFGPRVMARILNLFEVSHPVFGKAVPSREAAYLKGKKLILSGSKLKK